MRTYLCGVPFDPVTQRQALQLARRALRGGGTPLTVVTPNAVMAGKCLSSPGLADLLNSAVLSIPDGAGAVLASRFTGSPFPEQIPGIDFGYELLKFAAHRGHSVFLLGGQAGVAAKAAVRLQHFLPGLRVAGVHDGYYRQADIPQLLDAINRSGAQILFVCLGFPRQEQFLTENIRHLPHVRIAAGLGGSLDVWSGNTERAPESFRKLRLEWLWRCAKEPRRLRELRYGTHFLLRCFLRGTASRSVQSPVRPIQK